MIDAKHIAQQISLNLHDDYNGFSVDHTNRNNVPAGAIRVEGYIPGREDSSVSFLVTVSDVEVIP